MSQLLDTDQSHKFIIALISQEIFTLPNIMVRKKMKRIFESTVIFINWKFIQMPLNIEWYTDDLCKQNSQGVKGFYKIEAVVSIVTYLFEGQK